MKLYIFINRYIIPCLRKVIKCFQFMNYQDYCRYFGIKTFKQWISALEQNKKQQSLQSLSQSKIIPKPINQQPVTEPPQFNQNFIGNNKIYETKIYGKTVKFRWVSLSSRFLNIKLFYNGISPSDIYQRYINDCFFLASLSAIAATRLQIIFSLIKQLKQQTKIKKYEVSLIVGGQKKTIIINDCIPFAINSKNNITFPMYAFNTKSLGVAEESWVSLVQKAYAKAHGGYQNIELGDLSESFFTLIGCDSLVLRLDETDCWKKIRKGYKENLPMIVSTGSYVPPNSKIVNMHVYTILQARFDNEKQGILKLRNPFGHTQPSKQYALDINQPDDGIFQMTFEVCRQRFNFVSIANIIQGAKYFSLSIKDAIAGIVEVQIQAQGDYSFAISTLPYRKFFIIQQLMQNPRPKMFMGLIKGAKEQAIIQEGRIQQMLFYLSKQVKLEVQAQRICAKEYLTKKKHFFFFLKQQKWPSKQKILNFSVYGPSKVTIKQLSVPKK